MMKKNNTIMMKNNNSTTIATPILKQDDFTLEYYSVFDIYFLFYKEHPIWEGKFNELVGPKVIDYVFERESDPKKAESFISELHKWYLSQGETFEELLDEYKQLNNIKIITR